MPPSHPLRTPFAPPPPSGRHIYAMDAAPSRGALLLGDDSGACHVADARCSALAGSFQAAKKKNKIVSVHVNPADPNIFVTAGNDHAARIWDIRRCGLCGSAGGDDASGASAPAKPLALALATLAHPRVVNSACFSPHSGRKLLTTCQDNRLRVWDCLSCRPSDDAPDREIVHSHDFSRFLTAFRASWDPKDASENALVIGRYISEDYGGVALHPIDFMSAGTGRLLAAATDANVTTISPVVTPHPRRDVIAAGSSRNIFVWEPAPEEDDAEAARAAADAARGGGGGGGAGGRAGIPRMLDLDLDDSGKKKKGRAARDDDDEDGPFGGGKKKKGRAGAH
jgi:DNA damage-binding protein 2